jgi:hypothetical protein
VNGDGRSEVIWYHASAQTIYMLFWSGSTWQTLATTPGIGLPDHAVVGGMN